MLPEFQEMTDDDHGRYFVGTAFSDDHGQWLVENVVAAHDVYAFSGDVLLHHLLMAATSVPNWKRLEILKMEFVQWGRCPWLSYTCVFKTHYLRLVQRRWRTILRERTRILAQKAIVFLRNREQGGPRFLTMPGLRGMLADLRKASVDKK